MTPRFRTSNGFNPHIDLLEELTFNGTIKRFNLDFYCKAFGIKSPKETMCGYDVTKMIKEGKGLEVARYCYGDVLATAELFRKWDTSFTVK
ncbi:MAG: hypothetical protein KatS3mg083_319 [Candidatus Dojkabacteria bacterium]|nr:MAG: hypothetical protein KatS3mg083_319 [Candidatus Dojkabacteria bacterium]